jgi:hypothetical protein
MLKEHLVVFGIQYFSETIAEPDIKTGCCTQIGKFSNRRSF